MIFIYNRLQQYLKFRKLVSFYWHNFFFTYNFFVEISWFVVVCYLIKRIGLTELYKELNINTNDWLNLFCLFKIPFTGWWWLIYEFIVWNNEDKRLKVDKIYFWPMIQLQLYSILLNTSGIVILNSETIIYGAIVRNLTNFHAFVYTKF